MGQRAIVVRGLAKRYGEVTALDEVSLAVDRGRVLAVLGHNGAGKTTLINILTTRIRPSAGSARVCGFDVVRSGREVRRRIGVTTQFPALDDALSGRDNLKLVARLLGASARQAKDRAEQLISMFQLDDAADRAAGTYSGGMRRRLDLAASLAGSPQVLFLDEPTTGLDPISRTGLWLIVEQLVESGTTVVLTTQYLDEADRLAHDVVVLGFGRITARGTPAQLKSRLGARSATLSFSNPHFAHRALAAIGTARMRATVLPTGVQVAVALHRPGDLAVLVRALDAVRIPVLDLAVTEPTLNDVYLSLHQNPAVTR